MLNEPETGYVDPEILDELIRSPGACAILVHRAELSARKGEGDKTAILSGWLRKNHKIRNALNTAGELRMREIGELITEERHEFELSQQRKRAEKERIEALMVDVIDAAASLIPDLRERFA